MRIALLGSGGIGGYYGALLARGGHGNDVACGWGLFPRLGVVGGVGSADNEGEIHGKA